LRPSAGFAVDQCAPAPLPVTFLIASDVASASSSAEMILLFEDLQARHPTAAAIRVVLDNARYNHAKEVKAWLACDDCRVELVYLPAYAPNLNLIERFWWLFRKTAIYNEYFPTFADFKAAVEGFFARLDDYRDEIESLITDKFHFIGKFCPQAP